MSRGANTFQAVACGLCFSYAFLTGSTYDGQVIEGEDEIALISGK